LQVRKKLFTREKADLSRGETLAVRGKGLGGGEERGDSGLGLMRGLDAEKKLGKEEEKGIKNFNGRRSERGLFWNEEKRSNVGKSGRSCSRRVLGLEWRETSKRFMRRGWGIK